MTFAFCVIALAAVLAGVEPRAPGFFESLAAYEEAAARGDTKRAVRFGELALSAADSQDLLDDAGLARLKLKIAEQQVSAGNRQRALTLTEEAIALFDPKHNADERAAAEARLKEIAADLTQRGQLGNATDPAASELRGTASAHRKGS